MKGMGRGLGVRRGGGVQDCPGGRWIAEERGGRQLEIGLADMCSGETGDNGHLGCLLQFSVACVTDADFSALSRPAKAAHSHSDIAVQFDCVWHIHNRLLQFVLQLYYD